ncbi:hypothetical protein BGZ54_005772 [Gamsiella multidivaricata]|nr:hypothetical protein BGZ54_005772 [Gamsiella multidivaricata]
MYPTSADMHASDYIPDQGLRHHSHQHDPGHAHTFQQARSSQQQQAQQQAQQQVQQQYAPGHAGKISVLLNAEDAQKKAAPVSGKGIVEGKVQMGPRSVPGPGSGLSSGSSGGPRSGGARAISLGNLQPSSISRLSMSGATSADSLVQVSSSSLALGPGPSAFTPSSQSLGLIGGPKPAREGALGSRTQFHAPLEPEVIARLDELFFKFLQRICSDLNACDSKGDQIHQPLMAKKMQRLEASTDFRPFKFRIQAFTNAFHESLVQHGLTEDILPLRKVKVYLWKHKYISRFNEDGKKQKSKGNHVWNIEARRITDLPSSSTTQSGGASSTSGSDNALGNPSVRWEFREYTSRIAGQIIKFARVGVPYIYTPRIWDAQMSCPAAEYSSPWLPPWLKWHRGELRGIPGPEDKSCMITVVAEYVREGEKCHLDLTFPLTVSDPEKEGELMDSANEDEEEQDEDDDDDRGDGESSNDDEEDDDEAEYHHQDTHGGETRGRGRYRKQGRNPHGKERQESKRRKQAK